MPHLSSIRVEYSGGEEILESMAWAYELLLGQLYGGLEARELTFVNCGLSLGTVPSTELKLTRIETIWDTTFDETIELVRLNANTLRTLEMSCAQPTKLFKLLESRDNGGCVVYPNMRVLHLWSGNFTKYKCQSFKGNYSPFPQLEQLTMDLIYPFTDDVLFRGNTATLNYLRMVADPGTIQLLNSCNVFNGGRMESLRHVRVDVTCVAGISEMETSKLVADFIMSLAFRAQTLEIEGRLPKDMFLGAISQPENCQHLQHLLVNDLQLSLSDILTAIQSAPVLCYLHSQFIGLGDDLKGLPADQVVEHVEVKLKNASRHFKHWRLWHTPSTAIESAAQSVMTLASVFPKLTYSIVTSTVRAEYNSCIRKALTTPPFNNHKAALERLLFVGWD
ncbi:hypothetical protein GGI10_003956 [Coemansia sp. RSA 2530]|nr:hypothetical protein GGI10_003956 [Coemansia sp. RSA 2530]